MNRRYSSAGHAYLRLRPHGAVVSEMRIYPDGRVKVPDPVRGLTFEDRFDHFGLPALLEPCPAKKAKVAASLGALLERCEVGVKL